MQYYEIFASFYNLSYINAASGVSPPHSATCARVTAARHYAKTISNRFHMDKNLRSAI